jgi:hypothetical protein
MYAAVRAYKAHVPDMDLVVLIDDPSAGLESSHLVQMIGDLLQRVRVIFCTFRQEMPHLDFGETKKGTDHAGNQL